IFVMPTISQDDQLVNLLFNCNIIINYHRPGISVRVRNYMVILQPIDNFTQEFVRVINESGIEDALMWVYTYDLSRYDLMERFNTGRNSSIQLGNIQQEIETSNLRGPEQTSIATEDIVARMRQTEDRGR